MPQAAAKAGLDAMGLKREIRFLRKNNEMFLLMMTTSIKDGER
jgi:hypothetical protein